MRWQQGRDTLDSMINRGELERVPASREQADLLLAQAHQHVSSARAIAESDPAGAYQLLYDAARKALAAVLENQGLRATSRGGDALHQTQRGPRHRRGPLHVALTRHQLNRQVMRYVTKRLQLEARNGPSEQIVQQGHSPRNVDRRAVTSHAETEHVHCRRSVALDAPEMPHARLGILDGLQVPVELDRARRDDLYDEQDLAGIDPNRPARARCSAHYHVRAAARPTNPNARSGEDATRVATCKFPSCSS